MAMVKAAMERQKLSISSGVPNLIQWRREPKKAELRNTTWQSLLDEEVPASLLLQLVNQSPHFDMTCAS